MGMKTKTIIMLLLLLPCLINADHASSNGAVNDNKSKPYSVVDKLGGSSSSSGGSSRSSGGSYSSSGGSSRSGGGSYSSSGGSSRSGGGSSRSGGGGGSYRSRGGGGYRAGGGAGGYRGGNNTPDDDDVGHAAALPALGYTTILGLLLLCLA